MIRRAVRTCREDIPTRFATVSCDVATPRPERASAVRASSRATTRSVSTFIFPAHSSTPAGDSRRSCSISNHASADSHAATPRYAPSSTGRDHDAQLPLTRRRREETGGISALEDVTRFLSAVGESSSREGESCLQFSCKLSAEFSAKCWRQLQRWDKMMSPPDERQWVRQSPGSVPVRNQEPGRQAGFLQNSDQ